MATSLTLGGGAFGPNDLTAKTAGQPSTSPNPSPADNSADEHGVSPKTSRTRATSVTETGVETPRPTEKDTDTATEAEAAEAEAETNRRQSIVQSLARQYTQNSHAPGHHSHSHVGDIFQSEDPESPMNPNGKKFSAAAWAQAIVNLVKSDGHEFRTTGVAFQNMNVFGYGEATDYQKDVFNIWLSTYGMVRKLFGGTQRRIDILRSFDGVVRNGEMLVVLGPPGSGCSTLLKTIAGETNGIYVDNDAYFNYQGMTAKEMHTRHRGEAIYTAEVDVHFPQLSVGDTLTFAANARAPRSLPEGISKSMFANHLRDVVMAMFGISHTINTRVGNEYVRGVSGGERKRVTIAEAALSGAPLQCWDNSTRGLDSANAIEFCKTLRLQTELFQSTAVVSIYQSPQSAYDLFDKACVLYEGRQIFFGPADKAKQYFVNLGFFCPARATTPDFLTSMTSPQERIVREGFEGRVPRTPDEFAKAWKDSAEHQALQADIEEYKVSHPLNGADAEAFRASKRAQQAKAARAKSPFTLSYTQQVQLCLWRGWKRLIGDPSLTIGSLIANTVMALIISSIFFNLQMTTTSFFQRGALLFFACLMNAFASALEILTLFAQRPIVEKHARYALYHPSAEAVASMLCDLPYKIGNAIAFNLTLYFMSNLRREPGAFFFFLFLGFITVLTMSMVFRTIGSSARTLSQAMVPAAVLILGLVIFTGFVIPIDYMLPWCRWMNYIDPMAYAFESFMVNEFSGGSRNYQCTEFIPRTEVPGYGEGIYPAASRACAAVGSVPGLDYINGDTYIGTAFRYYAINKWRNVGIMFAFMIGFLILHMITSELVSEKGSKGEVLVFRRGQEPPAVKEAQKQDDESGTRVAGPVVNSGYKSGNESDGAMIAKQTAVFHWQDVCYDVQIKKETRRILDHVDGWVKPGTLTALMGVSGAGKTTLLDCLADRTSMGVIYGDMFVDGHERDTSFQRKTGYVQQQDLHLQTTTVREALNFSALLRQPAHVPKAEKLAYVEEVIKLLDMEEYADAVVGVPGEGLNVEQRKRLTIGVELVAKPPLLLFVDEPTSGLDSQTSWAILDLLEKLTKSGQAILCTIHQPSAMLFQRFDRLLFLAKGGRTVYFGDIGESSKTMTAYFEKHSGMKCPVEANPAEWMLEVIGAAPGTFSDVDWFKTWRESDECAVVHEELQRLKDNPKEVAATEDKTSYNEFAAPFMTQLQQVGHRVFQQYWRTPSYIYSKFALCLLIALYIGFAFYNMPNTIQGLQNQMFAIFNILTIFGQLVQQTMPHFVIQRDLYEVRERPSKVYGWKVFMLSQIIVEIPWNTLMAVIMFVCWYYPVGLQRNAEFAGQTTERGALMFLLMLVFLIFTSTFTDFIIAGFETAEAGANIANLLFMLCLLFCGVLARADTFPRFWIFMYRISPFTYLVSAMLSTALANTEVSCAPNEFVQFQSPPGMSCMEYMGNYTMLAGGYLQDESAQTDCSFCPIKDTNMFLQQVGSSYDDRWRNFGILWAFVIFNIAAALGLYWLARVPKNKLGRKKSSEAGPLSKMATLNKISSRASRASKTKNEEASGGVVEPALPKVDEKPKAVEPTTSASSSEEVKPKVG